MTCIYCYQPIIQDGPGHGFYFLNSIKVTFHNECIEMCDEIKLEEVFNG